MVELSVGSCVVEVSGGAVKWRCKVELSIVKVSGGTAKWKFKYRSCSQILNIDHVVLKLNKDEINHYSVGAI